MIQIVIQENSALKLELDRCYNKVAKTQKLEQEIAKVHRVHEELAASCERREKLERAARMRLQNECRRLTELNRAYRDQIDLLSARTDSPPIVETMRKELTQRELLIGQLITQSTIRSHTRKALADSDVDNSGSFGKIIWFYIFLHFALVFTLGSTTDG